MGLNYKDLVLKSRICLIISVIYFLVFIYGIIENNWYNSNVYFMVISFIVFIIGLIFFGAFTGYITLSDMVLDYYSNRLR